MDITSNSFQPWISRDAEPRNMEGGPQWTSASTDFGIHGGPRTSPPRTPKTIAVVRQASLLPFSK